MVTLLRALWERFVRKTRGKAPDRCINVTGSLTLLLQLGRNADVHIPIRDED